MMKAFGLAVALLVLSACSEDQKLYSDLDASKLINKELLNEVHIIYSDSAKIELRIKAPQMIRYTESNLEKEEFPKGLQAFIYDDQNNLVNTLASKYAIRIRNEGKTYLRDSVIFSSVNQEVLKTSELVWDEILGIIHTDKFVRIIRKDEIIQGYGFETDQRFKKGSIKAIDAIIPASKLYKEEHP